MTEEEYLRGLQSFEERSDLFLKIKNFKHCYYDDSWHIFVHNEQCFLITKSFYYNCEGFYILDKDNYSMSCPLENLLEQEISEDLRQFLLFNLDIRFVS